MCSLVISPYSRDSLKAHLILTEVLLYYCWHANLHNTWFLDGKISMLVSSIIFTFNSKDDRLPNMDAKKQAADFENDEEVALPTRERKHFPSNNGKIGYIIFTVSYS